jgi:diaminopimelate epimerase
MRFAKGHGTENDFVILPDPGDRIDLTAGLVARLCDRRGGLGADGVLRAVRVRGGRAGWFMDYRNADGSLAEMCGNGIRVFGRYLLDHGLVSGPEFAVATRAGVKLLRAEDGGQAGAPGDITVDMGPALVLGAGHGILAGREFDGLAVSLGNPHLACVVGEPLDGFDLSQPPRLDAGQFPEGANFELVRFAGDAHIEMRVHERGSGPTRSCGTGAVAAAVAAAVATARNEKPSGSRPSGVWTVDLPGGRLRVTLDSQTSFLSGPAVIVAEGEISQAWLSGTEAVIAGQSSPDIVASRSPTETRA